MHAVWWLYLYASKKLICCLLLVYLSVTFLIKSVAVLLSDILFAAGVFSGIITCSGESYATLESFQTAHTDCRVRSVEKSCGKLALCCNWLPYFINVQSFQEAQRIISNSSMRGM